MERARHPLRSSGLSVLCVWLLSVYSRGLRALKQASMMLKAGHDFTVDCVNFGTDVKG